MALMTALTARRLGDAPALIDEQGQCSWNQLDSRVNRLIRALRTAGVQPGERIALFAGNRRAVFELMTAATHCGVFFPASEAVRFDGAIYCSKAHAALPPG